MCAPNRVTNLACQTLLSAPFNFLVLFLDRLLILSSSVNVVSGIVATKCAPWQKFYFRRKQVFQLVSEHVTLSY